jgi:hypothetical protein
MTTAQPVVDVIVNNYNYEPFVGIAIRSALEQTYEHVTVIVVDDGSTDASREVIDSFDGRVRAVLKENGGQASAFNAGLERAEGDVVVFLDADDVLLPEAAERIADAYRRNPAVARIHYRMRVIDEHGRPTGGLKPPQHVPLPAGDLRPATLSFPFDLARPPTSGNAFSRRALDEIGPVHDCGPGFHADWYVVHLSDLVGPVAAIDEPLACYRVHGGNRHELRGSTLDLDHLRATIRVTATTRRHLAAAARRLGLHGPGSSMCEIADRAISRRLAPAQHPIETDTMRGLLALGTKAVCARFDIGRGIKALYLAWLLGVAISPRPLAARLGELFVFPSRREPINRWLAWLRGR